MIGGGLNASTHERVKDSVGTTAPKALVSLVLLLMSITLPSDDLKRALRSPGPAIWACVVNLILMPLLAWPLSLVQSTDEFRLGMLITASVPCTMATASVWTRKAGGNDAISLLVTTATSAMCWFVTPFWLRVLGGSVVELDVKDLIVMLLVSALAPIVVGQILRQSHSISRGVDAVKHEISLIAQGCVLTLVAWAAFQGGPQFSMGSQAGAWSFLLVGICSIVLHLAGMGIALAGCRLAGFARGDSIAVAFAASQKTLPIGILLAGAIGLPLALFPVLMFHAAQLFIDTPIAARFASGATRRREPASETSGSP